MLPLAAGVSAVVLAFRLPSAALVMVVPSVFTAKSYTVAPVAALVDGVMLMLLSMDVTSVLAAFAIVLTASNWLTFTASVGATPFFTPVMVLLPLFKPLPVSATAFLPLPAGGVITTPFAPTLVLLPAALVTVVPAALVTVLLPAASVAVTLFTSKSRFKPMVTVPSPLTWVRMLSLL